MAADRVVDRVAAGVVPAATPRPPESTRIVGRGNWEAAGGGIMPADNQDVEAIEGAYQDQIKALFKVLLTAVITHEPDAQSLERFQTGLDMARRAKQMALGALVATPRGREAPRPRRARARPK
jgi:hypothetical protein